MPINYGTNNVSTSGILTATSGNFINLIVNGTVVTGSGGATITSPGANRLLTSDGSSSGVIGQSNLTFNGSLLNVTGSGTFSNNITASGFIRSGGTSSQFLKADGTVDSNSYYLNSNPSGYGAGTVGGVGTSGYLARWTSTSGVASGVIYDNGSKIGISTITPSGELHVIGTGIFSSRLGVATNTPQYTLDVNGNANISGTLTFKDFTENVVAIGNSSTSQTLSLTNGTVQTCTLTGNCVFTMPTTTAGKSFTLFLNTGAGSFTASFTSVRWAGNTAPTITTTASKVDILSFISDGTYWYGSYSQNYG